MEDFILMNASRHPELVNYMGFAQQIDIEEDEKTIEDLSQSEPIYEDHITFEEMVLGIREGKFFKGRLNVSRVNLSEGSIMVEGLTDEIIVLGMKN